MLTTVRLDPELEARFAQLSFKMGRSKTYCIKEALEDYIDRSEYENELLVDAAEYRAGRLNTYSLDETKASSMASIRSDELERAFDAGEDIAEYMDMSTLERPNQSPAFRRISMDVPEEVVRSLDRAARRMGINRQAVIKVWLTERLDQEEECERARLATR